MSPARIKIGIVSLIFLCGVIFCVPGISNQWNAEQLGQIPVPVGYERVIAENQYVDFLRTLPLKKRGSLVRRYDGKLFRWQYLSAGVLDWKVLDKSEQCADVVMRIRAEYLWGEGRYADIVFTDVNGRKHPYNGGFSRELFENYLKEVYTCCNTTSVYHETTTRELKDIQPGDILVYPSRKKGAYGHAILVADIARNPSSGKIAILCVEGNTPACSAHIVRNANPLRNPWFILDGDEDIIRISSFTFQRDELRHY